MKKLKIMVLTLAIMISMSAPAFAMPESELTNSINGAKSDVIGTIDMTARQTVSQNYPVGAVYTTLDKDMDEDTLYEKFGGAWQEINSAFLWAAGSGTNLIPAIEAGERGGKTDYWLSAGIGFDEDGNFAFFTDKNNEYEPTKILTGQTVTAGSIYGAVPVIDEDGTYTGTDPFHTKIMPPHTVVKMFENVSTEFDNMPAGSLDNTRNEEEENLGIYFFAKPPRLVLKSGYTSRALEEPEDGDTSEEAEQYRAGMRYKVVAS